jgi:predicted phage baseplate assembly protein
MSRPLGLKEVTNPAAASGGGDPEPRDQARRNAPLTTLTLGRLVSLKDYEDFARAFSGIAKAQAAWLWDGGQRSVYLTVAGASGAVVANDSPVYEHLVKAIARYGLPYQPFQVASYSQLVFGLHARVQVDPLRTAVLVLQAARQAVLDAFSFDAREFARGVAASQVSAAIQAVPGVRMVDLDSLYLAGQTPSTALPLPPLPAAPAHRDSSGIIHPAELLTVDETRIEIIDASI